jgi:hypothetical protein
VQKPKVFSRASVSLNYLRRLVCASVVDKNYFESYTVLLENGADAILQVGFAVEDRDND